MKILLVDQERYENVRIENSKQYIMKIENEKKKKWSEVEVYIWNIILINRLNEMKFTQRKVKQKPALTHKKKKMWLNFAKKKQWGSVDNWMKVIFVDESRICIGQVDNTETFVWCHLNEAHKADCLKKTN